MGTFIGTKPVDELSVVGKVADQSNPLEVMNARIIIEPIICQQAAINAASMHIDELNRCMVAQRAAQSWRQYENADNRLHRIIAIASGNIVLLALFDQLNAIRRAVVWGRLRQHSDAPPTNHHSFSQHEKIIASIAQRDPELSALLMREHLEEVRDNLINPGKIASIV